MVNNQDSLPTFCGDAQNVSWIYFRTTSTALSRSGKGSSLGPRGGYFGSLVYLVAPPSCEGRWRGKERHDFQKQLLAVGVYLISNYNNCSRSIWTYI